MPHCPDCHSVAVIKSGSIHTGKQNYACKDCVRQCVEDPEFRSISDDTIAWCC